MVRIIIFMILGLFSYTIFLKYYCVSKCPLCRSHKVIVEDLAHYRLFVCQSCRFSYKDYYSFYNLTPIGENFEIQFALNDEDEEDEEDNI